MKKALISLVVALICGGAHGENLQRVKIGSADLEGLHSRMEKAGFDVGHSPVAGFVEVYGTDPFYIQPHLTSFDKIAEEGSDGVFDSLTPYYDPQESLQAMADLAAAYPNYAALFELRELLAIEATTALGDSLYALQVTSGAGELKDRPKVLMIGQHHAREVMTPHAVIDGARKLLADIAGDEQWRSFIENNSVWFVPVVNPYGTHHVFDQDRWWRKNRRDNGDGSYGVDINRNYEFKWGECGSNSGNGSSSVYRGPKAESEPETRIMEQLNRLLKAQFVISYHSSGDEVLYPYRCGELGDETIYYEIRDKLATTLGFGKRYASSSGEDFEQHYAYHGSISFLLEIGSTFQPDFSVYESTVKPNILKVIPFLKEELEQPFLTIAVESATGEPVSGIEVQVEEVPLFEGEIRVTDGFGKIRRRLEPGRYTVHVSAEGARKTQTVVLEASSNTYTIRL